MHQPNDKLLKATFSILENARAFFANHLPSKIAEAIEWSSLALEPASFIDTQLAKSESDLLFRVTFRKKDALIYLLFEHQSTEAPRMALRLLSYILRIWERFTKDKPPPARLPVVLPFVLAQGRRPWKTASNLVDLIDLPPEFDDLLRPWQPSLAYHLLELVRIPYRELAGTPEGILTLRALKAEPVNELLDDSLWDESLWHSMSEGALERLLRYIFNAEQQIPKLRERIHKIHTQPLKNKAMTLADQLRAEGKLEGRIEGKKEGLTEGRLRSIREAVMRALEIRHGRLPQGIMEALELINDHTRLERLHEGAIKAASIEEFAQML